MMYFIKSLVLFIFKSHVNGAEKCCKHSNWYITFNEALLGTDYIMITKPARHLISVIVCFVAKL